MRDYIDKNVIIGFNCIIAWWSGKTLWISYANKVDYSWRVSLNLRSFHLTQTYIRPST